MSVGARSRDRPAVLFDVLGTLLSLTPPHVILGRVLTALGRPHDEREAARIVARANRWWVENDLPKGLTREEELDERRAYVRMTLEDAGLAGDAELMERVIEEAYWARWARAFPDALPALDALNGEVRLGVLSNGGVSMEDAVGYAGFGGRFETAGFSRLTGELKPQPPAYLGVAARLGVEPARCWMVDDTPVNVEGALAVGMRGILLDRDGEYAGWGGERVATLTALTGLVKPTVGGIE